MLLARGGKQRVCSPAAPVGLTEVVKCAAMVLQVPFHPGKQACNERRLLHSQGQKEKQAASTGVCWVHLEGHFAKKDGFKFMTEGGFVCCSRLCSKTSIMQDCKHPTPQCLDLKWT